MPRSARGAENVGQRLVDPWGSEFLQINWATEPLLGMKCYGAEILQDMSQGELFEGTVLSLGDFPDVYHEIIGNYDDAMK